MAVNDVTWKEGSAEMLVSSGQEVETYWQDGTTYVQYEYLVEDIKNPWYYYMQQ